MPLRILVKAAITVVTPPVDFNSFPLPVTHPSAAVEPPRDRRRVAILLLRDCTAVVLRRHGGNGGATAVMAVPRRSHCGLAQPAVACGSFEHVESFRRAPAKVRSFDSFPQC